MVPWQLSFGPFCRLSFSWVSGDLVPPVAIVTTAAAGLLPTSHADVFYVSGSSRTKRIYIPTYPILYPLQTDVLSLTLKGGRTESDSFVGLHFMFFFYSIFFSTRLLDTGLDCIVFDRCFMPPSHALMLYDIASCYRLYVLYCMFTLCVDVTFTVKGDAIQDHNIISIHT